jgi:hypothetical protein
MLSLNFDLCLMHMLEIFKFEIVASLDLNSKEKIKRKEIRNSEEKGKPKEAGNAPCSTFCPSRPSSPMPLGRSPLLPTRWDRPIDTDPFTRAHSSALCAVSPPHQHVSVAHSRLPTDALTPPVSLISLTATAAPAPKQHGQIAAHTPMTPSHVRRLGLKVETPNPQHTLAFHSLSLSPFRSHPAHSAAAVVALSFRHRR